jgi:glycerol-3-phosphate acyltransferase PlsY
VTLGRALLVLVAYGLGSIPTGLWLGQLWKGVDVRRHGSGNLGATNVFRVLGARAGFTTLGIDIAKGLVPVLAARKLFPGDLTFQGIVGLAAIVGHTASFFVRFKGGKGVATSAGVFAALLPVPCAMAVITFALSFAFTRIVSLSSMAASLVLASSAFLLSAPRALAWSAAAVACFVFWTHRTNIQRLLRGNEPRIDFRKSLP